MSAAADLVLEPEDFAAQMGMQTEPDGYSLVIHIGSAESYLRGHVPGALHLPPQALVCGRPPVPGKLPDAQQLKQLFGYLGHTPETRYVVYDDEGGGWAGRFIWTLDVIGHPHYQYLNGGLRAWQAAQLPLQTEPQQIAATAPDITIHRAPIAEIEDILPRLNDRNFAVWDARSLGEYRGEKVLAQKGGHIPGAVHAEWTTLMDPERGFRIRTDAEAYLREKGLTRDKDVVTHCQSHHRSGFTYLVGKSLGFNIRGYHGSWAEWGNDPATPVAEE